MDLSGLGKHKRRLKLKGQWQQFGGGVCGPQWDTAELPVLLKLLKELRAEQEEKRVQRAATERIHRKRKQEEERQDGKKRRKGMFRIVVLCLFLYISHVLLNLMYSFPSLK